MAAELVGCSKARIIFRHMVPNIAAPFLIMFTAFIAQAILLEASLSFLGLGVPPPTASWGSMIGEGRESLDVAPRLAFMPAAGSSSCSRSSVTPATTRASSAETPGMAAMSPATRSGAST